MQLGSPKTQELKSTNLPYLQYIPKTIELKIQAPDSFIVDSPRQMTEQIPISKIKFFIFIKHYL